MIEDWKIFCKDLTGQTSIYNQENVFAQLQVQYLGFVLSLDGIFQSPEKVKAVKRDHAPKSVKQVGAFCG